MTGMDWPFRVIVLMAIGFVLSVLCGVRCDGSLASGAQRRRECASVCGMADHKVIDRVCRCADGKVTVLP